jgi:FMN-dependent NADH-azoreductase
MSFTILHIQSSPLGERSVSRKLGAKVLERLKEQHPDAQVISRDLVENPFPHLDGLTIGAFFTPADQRDEVLSEAVKLSDSAVDELMAADAIVIEAPMYNFSVPSTLKSWIDHIARAGRTFRYDESGPVGLVPSEKKVFICSARTGVYSNGQMQALDFQEPYLKTVLGFIGMTDVTFVRAEGLNAAQEIDTAVESAWQQELAVAA